MLDARPFHVAELATDRAIHLIGLTAGVIGAIAIVSLAGLTTDRRTFSAVVVYSLALLAMLGASAAYNCGRAAARHELRRRLDHAAIFVMIAGTYTPFTVGVLSGGLALGATAGVWSAALAGVIMKLWYPHHLEGLSTILYLTLGWLGLLVVPSLFGSLAHPAAILIVTGGILYSIGAGFQLWRALPFQNAIWHAFVVLAAGSHYAAILQGVVLPGSPP
jgi:hemolysin III